MKDFIKLNEKLYLLNSTLVNHIKDSGVVYQLSIEKKRNIFIIDQRLFVSLFTSLKLISKKNHCYVILSSKKTLRVNESMYQLLRNSGVKSENLDNVKKNHTGEMKLRFSGELAVCQATNCTLNNKEAINHIKQYTKLKKIASKLSCEILKQKDFFPSDTF